MFRMAFIDDSPLIATVCEKMLRKSGALGEGDKFDKFLNSGAFLQAFHHYGPEHYHLVVCDHHLEHGEKARGFDVLQRVQFYGYSNAAVLYSADINELERLKMVVDGREISFLTKDAPGNFGSIRAIESLVFQCKEGAVAK